MVLELSNDEALAIVPLGLAHGVRAGRRQQPRLEDPPEAVEAVDGLEIEGPVAGGAPPLDQSARGGSELIVIGLRRRDERVPRQDHGGEAAKLVVAVFGERAHRFAGDEPCGRGDQLAEERFDLDLTADSVDLIVGAAD